MGWTGCVCKPAGHVCTLGIVRARSVSPRSSFWGGVCFTQSAGAGLSTRTVCPQGCGPALS